MTRGETRPSRRRPQARGPRGRLSGEGGPRGAGRRLPHARPGGPGPAPEAADGRKDSAAPPRPPGCLSLDGAALVGAREAGPGAARDGRLVELACRRPRAARGPSGVSEAQRRGNEKGARDSGTDRPPPASGAVLSLWPPRPEAAEDSARKSGVGAHGRGARGGPRPGLPAPAGRHPDAGRSRGSSSAGARGGRLSSRPRRALHASTGPRGPLPRPRTRGPSFNSQGEAEVSAVGTLSSVKSRAARSV